MSTGNEISETGQVVYDRPTAKKINSLLNSLKTRAEGLELLNSYLPQCPDDEFVKYCISWMQNCCKGDNFIKNREYSIKLLGTLFQISFNYEELKKSVSFFITTRYFDHVLKYFLNSETGWACTEITLILYRGACGPFQETLEKHLKIELKKNRKISSTIARCFALLPSLGGAGNENLNYQRNWKIQFKKFLNVCHLILNNLFLNLEELQEYETSEDSYWAAEENQQNPEYLTFQLHNHCNVLNYMLLSQYPASKAVPADLVFQLIGRGLAINAKSIGKQGTTDNIALQKMLPEIHSILLSLLKALIATCKNQLLPYAYLICKLLRQSLEWTDSEFSYRGEKPFGQVRISVYETLCNWLIVSRSGGCVESISSVVIANTTADISQKQNIVVLKESKQKMQSHIKGQNQQVNAKANDKLCFAALKSLQYLLKFVGVLLKPEEHKFLQEFTIKFLIDIQKTSTSHMLIPFSVSKCRKEIYSLLLQLVQHPCPQWPPPTHFALRLFKKGVADECPQVSFVCSSSLNVIINLIHPQYNNEGLLPSETQETRKEWTSQPMEVDAQLVRSEYQNHEETPESDSAEKISNLDKSDNSSQEDLIKTVTNAEDAGENEMPEKSAEETNEEPVRKKPRASPETKHKTPEKEKVTPEKNEETFEKISKKTEESESIKRATPEVNQDKRPKKTYYLRSKTKGSSEESEEGRSPDNLRNTPLRGLMKATPKRSRTQERSALSKLESESETESKITKKSEDDEEDIIAVFDDSIIE